MTTSVTKGMDDTPHDALPCPSCAAAMKRLNLEGRTNGQIGIDLCFTCQGVWFDGYESTQISSRGVLELFRLIHEYREVPRQPLAERVRCPRCAEGMIHSMDVGKSGRFNYYRCGASHGRFTPFSQLMIEKGFVRQLAPAEIHALAARVGSIHCGSCGAPFDIRTAAVCPYCRAPVSILDPEAVERALEKYQRDDTLRIRRQQHDPLLAADILLASERERSRRAREAQRERPVGDLVEAGLEIIWGFLDN